MNALRLGDDAPFTLDGTLIYRPIPTARYAYIQMPENGGEVIWTEFDARGDRVMDSGDPATADTVIGVYGTHLFREVLYTVKKLFPISSTRTYRTKFNLPLPR